MSDRKPSNKPFPRFLLYLFKSGRKGNKKKWDDLIIIPSFISYIVKLRWTNGGAHLILFYLLFYLLDREGEVSVGERFVLQCEVPPLGVERLEAMAEHCLTQNHTVLELLGSDATFRIGRTL